MEQKKLEEKVKDKRYAEDVALRLLGWFNSLLAQEVSGSLPGSVRKVDGTDLWLERVPKARQCSDEVYRFVLLLAKENRLNKWWPGGELEEGAGLISY